MTKDNSPKPLRTAIYTRKSTSAGLEQDFSSIDAQREACEAYAKQQGWNVLPTRYDDGGFSGATTDRPAFQRLMSDVKTGRVDAVIVYKIDRLSRSLLDFVGLLDTFNRTNTTFISITQHFNTADAMGRLTLNILATFAQFEREMIAERTRDKVGAARRKGKWTGGTVPIGYHVVDKKLVIHPVEAAIVREAFRCYQNTGSAIAVAQHLNAAGHRTKQHVSALGKIRKPHPWDKGDVLRVLKNPLYAGCIRSRAVLHKGEHEALIDRETFDRIQAMLATKCTIAREGVDPPAHGTRNPEYLLAGLLRCPRCGFAYTPASTVTRGRAYRYYRAVSQLKRGGKACTCGHISAPAIEEYVVGRVREACASGNLAEEVTIRANQKLEARRRAIELERRDLPKSIATLAAQARRIERKLDKSYGAGSEQLRDQLATVTTRLREQQARLEELPSRLAELEAIRIEAEWVAQVIADFDAVWEALIPLNRLRLVQTLVRDVTFDRKTKRITIQMNSIGGAEDDASDTCKAASETANEGRAA